MKLLKKLLACVLTATMTMCTLTGCEERTDSGASDSDVVNTPKVKSFDEVLDKMSAISNCLFTAEAEYKYTDVLHMPTGDGVSIVEGSEQECVVTAALMGNCSENGDFALKSFTATASVNGEKHPYDLPTLRKIGDTVYVDFASIVGLLKDIAGEDAIPAELGEYHYISLTATDVDKYLQEQDTSITTDTLINKGDVAVELLKRLYDENKSLITSGDGTYSLTINKESIKSCVNSIVAMIDDGSLKSLLSDLEVPVFGAPTNDVDATLAELKTKLTTMSDSDLPDFEIKCRLNTPTASDSNYTITLSANATADNGYPTELGIVFKLTPSEEIHIDIPEDVTPVEEILKQLTPRDDIEGALS